MYASVNFYLLNTKPELSWQLEVQQKILFSEKCHNRGFLGKYSFQAYVVLLYFALLLFTDNFSLN